MRTLILLFLLISQFSFAQTPGTLDTGFGTNGISSTSFSIFASEAQACAVQPDGKIVAVGLATSGGTGKIALIRLNANGTIDATFGTNGKVQVATTTSSILKAVTILPNGKILAAGTSDAKPLLMRFEANGAVDNTFGTAGQVAFDGGLNGINDMKVDGTGKIVGTGRIATGPTSYVVFRRNADGSADMTFGTSGFATIPSGGNLATPTRIAFQGAKILVTGYYNSGGNAYASLTARLTSAGALDASFGTAGTTISTFTGNAFAENIAVAPDNKILICGRLASGSSIRTLVWRLTDAGAKDNTFGTNGSTSLIAGTTSDEVKALAIQTDGKVLVGGSTVTTTGKSAYIMRLNKAGTLDTSFGTNGSTITASGSFSLGYTITIQPDNKILLAGYNNLGTQSMAIYRYNAGSFVGTNEAISNVLDAQVYPNPAQMGSTITYKVNLEQPTQAQIEVFSLDGRLVATLASDLRLQAGEQSLQLPLPTALVSGMYRLVVRGALISDARIIHID